MDLNLLLSIISILAGMAGLVTGYIFYRKGLRVKEPCWDIHSNNLIRGYNSRVPELKVTFKDEEVENLTISRVVFWNKGAETIDKSDLNTSSPLKINAVNQIKLLEAKVISANNEANQFNVRESSDKTCAYIEFDYLDQDQGAVIQVAHSGTSSDDIAISGNIRVYTDLWYTAVSQKIGDRVCPFVTPQNATRPVSFGS